MLYSNKKQRKEEFLASLRQIIKDELAITAEHDMMKYAKCIKNTLAPFWLEGTDSASYVQSYAAKCAPGVAPVSPTEKNRVTVMMCRKWNKFLQDCFCKVSFKIPSRVVCCSRAFYICFIAFYIYFIVVLVGVTNANEGDNKCILGSLIS